MGCDVVTRLQLTLWGVLKLGWSFRVVSRALHLCPAQSLDVAGLERRYHQTAHSQPLGKQVLKWGIRVVLHPHLQFQWVALENVAVIASSLSSIHFPLLPY